MDLSPNFFADIGGISFIYQIFQRNRNMAAIVVRVFTIVLIVDSDKTDIMERKILLNLKPRGDRISTQTGQILNHNAVNSPRFGFAKHTLKGSAIKCLSAYAIIRIYFDDFDVRAESNICLHDLTLRFQGVTVVFIELYGKPDIKRSSPYFHG